MLKWIADINTIASVASIIGLLITIFLFVEAREIKKTFIIRARIPETNKELAKAASEISVFLKTWDTDKESAIEKFFHVKALLENVKKKLPIDERSKVEGYIKMLQDKRSLFRKNDISNLNRDEAFKLYSNLKGLITTLRELAKDNTWN